MTLGELRRVLAVFESLACPHWLEGGWGVDALVGRQTRAHRDVDVDFDARFEARVLAALEGLGYAVETDWRPNRVELAADGERWVDLHPLQVDADGAARQAALGGGWHEFPASYFTTGRLGDVAVPCLSLEAQLLFHSGYQLRDIDAHDLALLEGLRTSAPLTASVGGDPLIVVTGVPGAGKTTLGAALAQAIGAPLLSLDTLKETLYGAGADHDPYELRLAAEAELSSQLSAVDGAVVVDIWVAPERDTDRVAGLLRATGRDVVELLCRVRADIAVERYGRRQRSGPHKPADAATLQRIRDAAVRIQPLGLGRCVEVDTSSPVDVSGLVEALRL